MQTKTIKAFFARRIRAIKPQSRLAFALGLAIMLSLLLVCVSVAIYSLGGFSKLDLSRPGFEHERTEVRAGESSKVYDTTSPVTRETIDDFLKDYDVRAKELHEFGDFKDQALDDASLQLGNQQPALQ